MTLMIDHDVVVVGAGPPGLMLAAELALAGVEDVDVVERRRDQALVGSRAGGFHARTLEVLGQRGVAAWAIRGRWAGHRWSIVASGGPRDPCQHGVSPR